MKIICVSASNVPSSTANSIQVMKACQALVQLGHEVRLLVPRLGIPPSYWVEREEKLRESQGKDVLEWDRLASIYGLADRFEIEWLSAHNLFRRYDFSLVAILHAIRLDADLLYVWPLQAAVFSLLGNRPVVLEIHGPPEGALGPTLYKLFRRLPGRKRLLPITQALAGILSNLDPKPFQPGDIVVAPNGVDLERYKDLPEPKVARRQLALPEGLTIGYTGHLYAGRGMELLVELARRFPRLNYLWVGGRESDVQLWRERLAHENIANVFLTGYIENDCLSIYQAASEILIMPYERVITGSSGGNSAEYCSPMKMFEYMASGQSIISSDLPVIQEVLNNNNALLCPPEDIQSWVKAITWLSEDPEERARLGSQAQLDVLEYTWLSRARRALAGFVV
jgi:glycosyltransferase involved in cell wall biosynthesis